MMKFITWLIFGIFTIGTMWGQSEGLSKKPASVAGGVYYSAGSKLKGEEVKPMLTICGQRLDEILELALSYIDDPAKRPVTVLTAEPAIVRPIPSEIERAEEQLKALKKKAADVEKIRQLLECVKK